MKDRILLDEILQTNRLFLRKRTLDDNAFIFEATRYEGFNEGMPWNAPETIKEMEDRYYKSLTDWINGTSFTFTIVEINQNHRVGMISIRKSENANVWNIGYWTHPKKQNMGYMSEAIIEVLNFGFTRLNAISIEAQYALWNIQSEKILIKSGMKKVEYIEKGFIKNDKWIEENRMEITNEEWKKRRRTTAST